MDDGNWHGGLDDAFETKFNSKDNLIEGMIEYKSELIDQKNDIVERTNDTGYSLADAQLMRREIQDMIVSSKAIMVMLESTLLIGAPPRAFEVYSTLLSARLSAIKELRDLSKTEIDCKVIDNNINGGGNTLSGANGNMLLSSTELDDLINKVAMENTMDSVDATFDVSEEDGN